MVRLVCEELYRVACLHSGLEESGEGLLLLSIYTMFTETQDSPK